MTGGWAALAAIPTTDGGRLAAWEEGYDPDSEAPFNMIRTVELRDRAGRLIAPAASAGKQAGSRAERRARGDRAPMKRGRLHLGDVDHGAQTIGGRVELARPGPCPHRLRARSVLTGELVDGACTGEAGHLARAHVDQYGRSWE